MAMIGLKHPVYKSATKKGVIGKAIQADIKITSNNVKLYADDSIAEEDKSFQSGAVALGIDDLSDTVQSDLLGHTVVDGEITANENDESPNVGFGFYGVKKVRGKRKYRAIWLTKVKFSEPSDEHATKEDGTTFKTPVLEGSIMLDDNGDWKKEKTFDTEAEAIAYVDGKADITPQCVKPVASIESGTYAAAQSVTLIAGDGETIYYTTDGTSPSKTNGTEYSIAIDIATTCALRAISVKIGYSDSEIATYEYIITA